MTDYYAVRGPVIAALLACLVAAPAYAADDSGTVEVPGATIGRIGESAAVDPDEYEFSEAETRLWMSDHLANIEEPTRLYYEFVREGSLNDGFSDSVFLDILEVNADGTKNADMQFFTGSRAQPFTPANVTEITGNPVLLVFMNGDVMDMNRLTGGNQRYFQRGVRMAFSDDATVEPAVMEFNGEEVEGLRISVTPFVDDPRRRQFERFAGKRYEFLLSDRIPGTLYQIHTVVPGENGSDEPLVEETLTLRHVEPRDAGS